MCACAKLYFKPLLKSTAGPSRAFGKSTKSESKRKSIRKLNKVKNKRWSDECSIMQRLRHLRHFYYFVRALLGQSSEYLFSSF